MSLAGRLGDALAARRLPTVLTDSRGLSFELVDRDEVVAFRRHGGHFEQAELDFAARVPAGGLAIDVGASIGAFTAAMARAVGPTGRVISFEPLEASAARLRRTIELNDLHNVEVRREAIGSAEGEAELLLYGPGRESWSSLTRDHIDLAEGKVLPSSRVAVPTTTLDAYCVHAAIEHIALLKIDVEGAEAHVVRGAAGLFGDRRVDVALMELSDNTLGSDGVRAVDLLTEVRALGYAVFVLGEDGAEEPYAPEGHVEFANVVLRPAG